MLFRRRSAPSFAERFRVALWPRRNWYRSIRYILMRLKRLPSSPHRIAVGCATGVFAIFTPFLGGQLIMCAALAWMLRGSIIASFLGSFAGNPLTYPFIWVATYNVGQTMLGSTGSFRLGELQDKAAFLGDALHDASTRAILMALEALWPILKPMAVGALPLGGLAAAATYVSVRRLIRVSRAARQQRKLRLRTAAFSA